MRLMAMRSAFGRRRLDRVSILAGLALLAALVLLAPSVSAAPKGAFVVGTNAPGTTGSLFDSPVDIAVRDSTGDAYVTDKANHRVQRFAADGTFELAWGFDIDSGGGTGFEVCTSAASCKAGDPVGGEGGRLASPVGIAVDQDDGSVYVWNLGNARIEKFDADGAFQLAWGFDVDSGGGTGFEVCTSAASCKAGVTGVAAGQLGSTFQNSRLAVSPATGNILVADGGNRRISEYQADGTFVRAWGWDVDPAGTTGFEICDTGTTCKQGLTGTGFRNNHPEHVGVGPNGIVYGSSNPSIGDLLVFDSGETVANDFLESPMPGVSPLGIEVDADDSHAFVVLPGTGIVEYDPVTRTPLSTHLVNALPAVEGFGRSSVTGEEYLASGNRVIGLTEAGAPLATVPASPAVSNVGVHSAQFDGSVTPNGPDGIPATARFEVSEDGISWTPVGSPVDLGTGNVAVPVSQNVTGLEANEHYQVRLMVTKPFGNPAVISDTEEFDTPLAAPEVDTGAAQFISARSGQVAGRINPNNSPSTYYVEYGETTSYGSRAPVSPPDLSAGDEGTEETFLVVLEGLEPETTYHYRFVASNVVGTTEGDDAELTTRALPDAVPVARGLEMVTPPDKANRRVQPDVAVEMPNVGVPSPDGESFFYTLHFGILDGNAGVKFPHTSDVAVLRRGPDGWQTDPLVNIASPISGIGSLFNLVAASADLNVQAWQQKAYVFPSESTLGTRVFGDSGGLAGSGWYDWLVDPAIVDTVSNSDSDAALIDDEGERMLRWSGAAEYKGLLGPSDPSADLEPGADALYLQSPPGSGPRELVSECTGAPVNERQDVAVDATGGTFTLTFDGQTTATIGFNAGAGTVEARLDSLSNVEDGDVAVVRPGPGQWQITFTGTYAGLDVPAMTADSSGLTGGASTATVTTVTDGSAGSATIVPSRLGDGTISGRPCAPGSLTTTRGAVGGGGGGFVNSPGGGVTNTAMSDDGARVFFTSPDPDVLTGQAACTTGTGAGTECPSQIFVRQYDSAGEPTVKWLSRSEIDGQQSTLFSQVGFEGASSDGQVVFFKTKTPLTEDDPNGGAAVPGGVTTGTASDASWDLYRYELPGDRDTDPAGGELTRVSGGPAGAFDPSVHTGSGSAGALRYLSEDGQRAYFVTRGIIGSPGDSWNEPPEGSETTPSGTTPGASTRNLYLYDAAKVGDERWQFIARLPTTGHEANPCASLHAPSGMAQDLTVSNTVGGQIILTTRTDTNCVHGTPDGGTIAFESAGQLTGDDTDPASDVYVYDEARTELVRATPPIGSSGGYVCGAGGDLCNGDFGFRLFGLATGDKFGLDGSRHQNVAEYGASGGEAEGAVGVFFETKASLTADDVDGGRMDVYEWQRGAVRLVSPAEGDHDAFFSGNSLDGEDVFFMTTQRIDPREIDEDADIYDARIGGGFPYTPPPPGCDPHADACQGSGADGLNPSRGTDGVGNPDNFDGQRVELSVKSLSKAARKRAAQSGTVRLAVRADGAGRARAVARARVGGKLRRVGAGTVRFAKAGRKTVRLKLSKAARARLRSGKALSLRITVSMSGALPQSVSVKLERSGR